jgi:hypothetical protein
MNSALQARSVADVEKELNDYLDVALACEVKLGDDDSAYDLKFIGQKLHLCSTFTEKLSECTINLTRLSIMVNQVATAKRGLSQVRGGRLRASKEYSDLPRAERAEWLANQLEDDQLEAERWVQLKSAVSHVKEAVADRAQSVKRIDSDLRLQSKLLEVGIAHGASNPNSFQGSGEGIDLG